MALTSESTNEQKTSAIPLVLVVLTWIGISWFAHERYEPPPLVGPDDLKARFSAVRAEPIFQRLYQDASPHPAGENAAFREKVIGEFRRLGYQVELHETSSPVENNRSRQDTVSLVNLIVRLEGKTDKPCVMLTAHYDSVPQSPGAADDGVGLTALIEIARTLRDEPPLDRTIIFLVTDGEEYGLLGARKFVEEHELANDIAAVINLEARGTSGPSLMFETSEDSAWLVDLFARTSRRPFTSSLFFEIYRFLPNDTDFTVFRRHGIKGFNFAFIGDVRNYHSSFDNFDNVDRRSLQHHGENALPLLRELANTDIETRSQAQAVYFDVFGYFVLRWPTRFSAFLSLAGLLLVFWFSNWRTRMEQGLIPDLSGSRLKSGLSILLVSVGIMALALFGKLLDMAFVLDGAVENPWPDQPLPVQASYWSFGFTVLMSLAWLLRPRLDWRAVWFGVWLIWSTFALCTSTMLVGASYLFVVPLAGTGIAVAMAIFVGQADPFRQAVFVSCMGAITVGLIWMPIERLFYDALGFRMNVALILRVAIVLPALLPLMVLASRKALGMLTCVGLIVSATLSMWAVLAN